MTVVKNSLPHLYQPTVGGPIAPQGIADIDVTGLQEQDALQTGALLALDGYVVPAPPAQGYPEPTIVRRLLAGGGATGGEPVIMARRGTDAYPRFEVTTDGEIRRGDGTEEPIEIPVTDGSYIAADSGAAMRLIVFGNGTVTAIPVAALPPGPPTDIAVLPKLSSVRISWTPGPRAAQTILYRNSAELLRTTGSSYRDLAVTVGQTYNYQVQSLDQYGQHSTVPAAVAAYIDPALNVAPVVAVKAWPPSFPNNGRTLLRVNASDANAQTLALDLDVDAGTLAPTDDPSVWIYTP